MTLLDETGRAVEEGAHLWRGVALILVAGVALGVAQNALMRRGETQAGLKDIQRRSLAWVKDEVTIPQLADLGGAAGETALPAATSERAPEAGEPVPGVETPLYGAEPAAAPPLPMIPNLPQPIEIHLVVVKAFFDQDAAAIIDARTPEEFAEGHIPGAINLPFDEAVTDPARLESFDANGRPTIVYCGGGTCESSMSLAFALLQAGQKRLLVFMGGYPEWVGAGFPVATRAVAGRTP